MAVRLDEYLKHRPQVREGDHRGLQKAAMREVIELSENPAKSAANQIDEPFSTARKQAEERYDALLEKIERRFRMRRDAIQTTHRETLDQAEDRHQAEMANLETDRSQTVERIEDQSEHSIKEAKSSVQQEIWLADSVADAALEKLNARRKELKAQYPALVGELDEVASQAHWQLQQYHHRSQSPDPTIDEAPIDHDPFGAYEGAKQRAEQRLEDLETLGLPGLFVGIKPWAIGMALCVLATGGAVFAAYRMPETLPDLPLAGGIAFVVTAVGLAIVARVLRQRAHQQVEAVYVPFLESMAAARKALQLRHERQLEQLDQAEREARQKHDSEVKSAERQLKQAIDELKTKQENALERVKLRYTEVKQQIDAQRDHQVVEAKRKYEAEVPALEARYQRYRTWAKQWLDSQLQQIETDHARQRDQLRQRWRAGLSCINHLREDLDRLNQIHYRDFKDPAWADWQPPAVFSPVVRFGTFQLDLQQLADRVQKMAPFEINGETGLQVPALLSLPSRGSLLMQTDGGGRDQAIRTLRAVMVRLLTSLPPGRVQFTILDPVGLGENFAGFMHLADYQESLVSTRIWTESGHIEQRLTDLTEHMENVIQKYLRNEFDTIDAYNKQAGELAEPYRFLVVANFPVNFTEDAAKRLISIVTSGARCGVHTLIAHDTRQPLPPGINEEDLHENTVHLVCEENHFVWQDEIFKRFPLAVDDPPNEQLLTDLMHRIGKAAKESSRVEVPFSFVAPKPDQVWSAESTEEINVPVGRSGAVRLQPLRLGRGVAQHALIAGKTGSGKSTLLHILITNLVLWYRPDEVEFYLVDFKKGVEFKTYATHHLPHARAVAIESDREFGLSVLQRLDEEMERRGQMFRSLSVQDIAGYRRNSGKKLPRTLLIVDEFQIFFSEDDKLAQDASILLDRLVRQGRAFGIHVILGSQTLAGTAGLPRSTIGQMAVRIALQCSESDSQMILDDNNAAARLLSRPGEAIYNDAGGLLEGNSPFQTAWLTDSLRDEHLDRVAEMAVETEAAPVSESDYEPEPLIVFEGNAPADIRKNRELNRLVERDDWPDTPVKKLWVGDPVAIKEPTAVSLRRQSAANVMVIGQRDDAAMAMLSAGLVSLALQHDPRSAKFYLFDGSPSDSPMAGTLQRMAGMLPHISKVVEYRDTAEVIGKIAEELHRRTEAESQGGSGAGQWPAVYLFIYGLQRYRVLRRSEDSFGLLGDDEAVGPKPDKAFAELLRDGPPVGIHVITWIDTPAAMDRTLDRSSAGEFDHRVLFQMSSADSSNLIDSPAANLLGYHRALYYSEEQGTLEKFRPYAALDPAWLEQVKTQLQSR